MPRQRPLAQLRLLLRTTSLTSPGSASLLLAPRCLPPALLPPASARLPAHCYRFCLLQRPARLFPLLQGVIDTPQANENPLEVYPQRQASCQRDRLLHEHKRLFVGSPLQQAIREAERTVDLYPDVLNLFRQRQRHVTTAQAVMHLPIMHLRLRQQPPAHGFRCPIRQRLGGRCTQDKGWHAQLSRRAWLASQLRI